jgi:LPPG:FO 2-phospho-L-lactate transferase
MARYLAITGGVGGAKLALGLTHLLGPHELTFLVNTGDDFEHLGLHVSPDLDTLMYTLSDLANRETGWGRAGESWHFIETLRQLGGEGWFNLGDRDLAVHVRRTNLLREQRRLTEATKILYEAHDIAFTALPMSDAAVRTEVETDAGILPFQHYFVRERCAPRVRAIRFVGADCAQPSDELIDYLRAPDLAGIVICPSNPFLSIDPIVAIAPLRTLLMKVSAPIIAVSPIIAGAAIKGPTAKIMQELSLPLHAGAIAAHYGELIQGFILDKSDASLAAEIAASGMKVITANSLMQSLDDRIDLAHTALEFLGSF